jgi:hypothetical protein
VNWDHTYPILETSTLSELVSNTRLLLYPSQGNCSTEALHSAEASAAAMKNGNAVHGSSANLRYQLTALMMSMESSALTKKLVTTAAEQRWVHVWMALASAAF